MAIAAVHASAHLAVERSLADRILRVLQQEQRPLGVYQMAQKLTTATGQLHHPNSIYRAIATLRKRGHVLPVASAKGWAIRTVPGDGPVIVLLCRACWSSRQVPAPEIEAGLGEIPSRQRFEPQLLYLEVIGHCQACLARTPDS